MWGFCAFATYATARFVWGGIEADETTQGMLEVPLWWPQSSMVLGMGVLSLAVIECVWDVWCGRVPIYTAHELDRVAQHDFSERV
jgi:TRAP-type C4-dicarboxylate transport system permease small subunit